MGGLARLPISLCGVGWGAVPAGPRCPRGGGPRPAGRSRPRARCAPPGRVWFALMSPPGGCLPPPASGHLPLKDLRAPGRPGPESGAHARRAGSRERVAAERAPGLGEGRAADAPPERPGSGRPPARRPAARLPSLGGSAGLLSTVVASGGISCLKEDQIRLFENDFFFFFSEWSLYYTMLSIYFERLLDCAGLAFQKPIFFLFG